tara:strand:- start:1457 stop:2428 length:972 start_codon:yes stop_codon:yes gene_type:complete
MLGLGTKISTPHTFNRKHVDRVQKSVELDGTTDFLEVADHNNFSPTDGSNNDKPFSFACWVKRNDSANFSLLGKGDNTSSTMEYRVFILSNKIYFDIFDNSQSVYRRAFASSAYTGFGSWTHIGITYDGNEHQSGMKIYINGERISNNTTSGGGASWDGIANTNSDLTFGHLEALANYDLNGLMADIMYWKDFELTAPHMKYLYGRHTAGNYSVDPTKSANGGLYSTTAANACVGWWKCTADYQVSSTTTYEAVEDCAATTVETSVCVAQGVEVSEGEVCCKTTTTENGIQDSCSTTHHAKYKNNASLTAANSANTPTLQTAL